MSIITAHAEKKTPSRGPLFPWMVLIRGNEDHAECVPFHGGQGVELEGIKFDFGKSESFKLAYAQATNVIERNSMLAEAEEMQG